MSVIYFDAATPADTELPDAIATAAVAQIDPESLDDVREGSKQLLAPSTSVWRTSS